MNQIISAALAEHADGDIHIERLLDAVHTGARRRRKRRLLLTYGAVLVVAAVGVTSAVPVRQAVLPGTGPLADPRPPHVEGVPAAVDAPEVLGADPTLFHLDLTELAGSKDLSWSSRRDGHEELMVTMDSGDSVHIEADRNPERLGRLNATAWPVTVAGKPAEAAVAGGSHVIRWQPVPGIWAQVEATGKVDNAIDVAERLRLDRVYRCAVPFRLDRVTSPRMIKCLTNYSTDDVTGRWTAAGQVWFTIGEDTLEYQVAVGKNDPSIAVNDTIAGRAVESAAATGDRPQIRYPYDGRTAYFWAHGPTDPAILRSLVAAFSPVTAEDPQAWPRNPFA